MVPKSINGECALSIESQEQMFYPTGIFSRYGDSLEMWNVQIMIVQLVHLHLARNRRFVVAAPVLEHPEGKMQRVNYT